MDIVLIVLGAICLLVGIAGCILPVLPGVPLAYGGLILLHFTDKADFSWQFLTIWGVVTVVVQVLDYFIPAWGTKKFGGSKWGVWGSTIGMFVGLAMGPMGIIVGPFVGAVIGELLYFNRQSTTTEIQIHLDVQQPSPEQPTNKSNLHKALRAGFGSFIGLLAGTLLKMVCCIWMAVEFVKVLV
jgi:uncharacterized protein YqgC (DUF456 family)